MTDKWQNVDAGPRQVKDLHAAMGALQWEGKNHDELTGVIGGEEHRSTFASMCGPVRPEVVALDEAIRAKYGHQVTKATVRAIIADYRRRCPRHASPGRSRTTGAARRRRRDQGEGGGT